MGATPTVEAIGREPVMLSRVQPGSLLLVPATSFSFQWSLAPLFQVWEPMVWMLRLFRGA